MGNWIVRVLEAAGYPGLTLLAALECVFPPIPSELIFPLAGYLAQQGEFSIGLAILAGAVGSTAGSLPLYALGRHLGMEGLEAFVEKHCRWTAVTTAEVQRAARWFDRHGSMAVLLAHLVPGLRSLIALPAGVHGMSLGRFLVLTAIGSAVWIAALVALGYELRAQFADVDQWLDPVTWAVFIGAAAWYAWRVLRPRRRRDTLSR